MKNVWKMMIMAIAFVGLTACAAYMPTAETVPETTETMVTEEEMKASDTVMVVEKDPETKKIIFQTLDTGRRYELSYTDATPFYDRYGQAIVIDSLPIGEITDVQVSVHSKTLDSLQTSNSAFSITGVDSHVFNMNKGVLSVHDDNYKVNDDLVVVTESRIGELMDINEEDVLTLRGVGHQVYSVSIEKGHGYVRLTGDESFRGGFIEIGQRIIRPIEDHMLVLVPEGEYDMRVTYHGYGGTKPIEVIRNKETIVDISDLKGELLKNGTISFLIHPSDASLFINGEETDANQPVKLEYGVYEMVLRAEGYTTIKKYISVGQELANIEITMETVDETASANKAKSSSVRQAGTTLSGGAISTNKAKSTSKSSSSRKSTSSSTSTSPFETFYPIGDSDDDDIIEDDVSTDIGENQLYIDGPEGVEVYYDGTYKGIAPCNFAKTAGVHIITLRKEGYQTKSYTLTLQTGTDNETYSFTDLLQE